MEATNVLTALRAHPPATFVDIVRFNDHHICACDITGISPVWEMHPDTDEWFYCIEGELKFTVLTDDGSDRVTLRPGDTYVVPRTLWHRPAAPDGAKFLYLTPGTTLHSEADDPRAESAAAR